ELVAARLRALGGQPKARDGVVTDNGQLILDVSGLKITDPAGMEAEINQWPGVVTVGLFARKAADVALVATPTGIERRSARVG
ncbi:MAG TPA: ribose-5-phosphate isomerase A, partial [Quisquiliibacterium sp.]|nr:ribose-5-phosphate isomerase A [Quisquiliibacterium sp.]